MIFRKKKQYTVYTYGAPVLKKLAEPVDRIDGNILEIGNEMLQAVEVFEGIGLAAPQIGISLKMMALNPSARVAAYRETVYVDTPCNPFRGYR